MSFPVWSPSWRRTVLPYISAANSQHLSLTILTLLPVPLLSKGSWRLPGSVPLEDRNKPVLPSGGPRSCSYWLQLSGLIDLFIISAVNTPPLRAQVKVKHRATGCTLWFWLLQKLVMVQEWVQTGSVKHDLKTLSQCRSRFEQPVWVGSRSRADLLWKHL